MDFRKVLPLLVLLMYVATPAFAAQGDVDTLCKITVNDLSAAGGCVDEDGIVEGIFSTGTLLILGGGSLAILIVLAVIAGRFFGIRAREREKFERARFFRF